VEALLALEDEEPVPMHTHRTEQVARIQTTRHRHHHRHHHHHHHSALLCSLMQRRSDGLERLRVLDDFVQVAPRNRA
jgi:hypothetical protein